MHSFFDDVRSFHARYVSAVSETETSAFPLCSPDSFRDAASIQQAMSQLQARIAVAKEFSSPETLLSKMPQYVEAIDATDAERKSFLDGFSNSARKDLGARKDVSDNELSWAQSCTAVYNFAIAIKMITRFRTAKSCSNKRARALSSIASWRLPS